MEELLSNNTISRVKGDNSFDALRYFFSFSLIFFHFCTATNVEHFWFVLGGTCVKAFFIITGFLVMYSYLQTNNLKTYARKRFNRIVPAYVATILFCFFIGISLTSLPLSTYFTSAQTYKYLLANLCFLNFVEPCLPGVFDQNYMNCMDGSLWTMKVEVLFYIMVPFFVWCFQRWKKWIVLSIVFLFSLLYNEGCAYLYAQTGNNIYSLLQHQLGGYLAYFFGGVLILLYFDYFCRNIKYIFPVCLLLYFLCKQKEGICYIIEPIAFASIIIGIAYFCKPFYFLKKYDNISYGLFLFHFPIIQTLIHFHIDEYNIYLAFALTIVLTIAIATFSWYVIEKRWSILSKAKE